MGNEDVRMKKVLKEMDEKIRENGYIISLGYENHRILTLGLNRTVGKPDLEMYLPNSLHENKDFTGIVERYAEILLNSEKSIPDFFWEEDDHTIGGHIITPKLISESIIRLLIRPQEGFVVSDSWRDFFKESENEKPDFSNIVWD